MTQPGEGELARFPIGFERFHRRAFLNYQLNRACALGYADAQELRQEVARIRSPEDCFDAAFGSAGVVRHDVAYGGAVLPAYRYPSMGEPARATVLLHGGFDSLIEEFFAIWQRIAAAGFDVVAFEGPGQGGARALSHLTFDHDWEKPVGAVLDHFALRSAGLVGISMGGYWALRAAGRERASIAWCPGHRCTTGCIASRRCCAARREQCCAAGASCAGTCACVPDWCQRCVK